MNITVDKKDTILYPDKNRVIARYFYSGDHRAREIIKNVINLSDEDVQTTLNQTLRKFSKRHRNISKLFKKHHDNLLFHFADLFLLAGHRFLQAALRFLHAVQLCRVYRSPALLAKIAALGRPKVGSGPLFVLSGEHRCNHRT